MRRGSNLTASGRLRYASTIFSSFWNMILTARIAHISSYLPAQTLDNEELAQLYPGWSAEKIYQKTGIVTRHIAAETETSSDLAVAAAQKLLDTNNISPLDIDFLILCTQTPDYFLPTTACLLQARLEIPTTAGAFDLNLGCSGFVYGLSIAKGLIETGAAQKLLLLTADTYSKIIHPLDKSVRTLFGDGATATLIEASDRPSTCIGPFLFGTDGSGARNLIVEAGGFRLPRSAATTQEVRDESENVRSQNHLFMNGSEIMTFTLSAVTKAVEKFLIKVAASLDDFDYIVMHQANRFMLDALRKKLKIPEHKFPIFLAHCGNTSSSSIPIALESMIENNSLKPGSRLLLVGFGVGYSWAVTQIKF
jgi:3-oxoacyl-[acyl-carrier-protein] synthase III